MIDTAPDELLAQIVAQFGEMKGILLFRFVKFFETTHIRSHRNGGEASTRSLT